MQVRAPAGTYVLPTVHATDRNGNPMLLFRSVKGGLQRGDRYVDVKLIFSKANDSDGYDAYAANRLLRRRDL